MNRGELESSIKKEDWRTRIDTSGMSTVGERDMGKIQ